MGWLLENRCLQPPHRLVLSERSESNGSSTRPSASLEMTALGSLILEGMAGTDLAAAAGCCRCQLPLVSAADDCRCP